MQQLIQIIESALQKKTANAAAPIITTSAPAISRVLLYTNNNT